MLRLDIPEGEISNQARRQKTLKNKNKKRQKTPPKKLTNKGIIKKKEIKRILNLALFCFSQYFQVLQVAQCLLFSPVLNTFRLF